VADQPFAPFSFWIFLDLNIGPSVERMSVMAAARHLFNGLKATGATAVHPSDLSAAWSAW
jgi:hypothetical protein